MTTFTKNHKKLPTSDGDVADDFDSIFDTNDILTYKISPHCRISKHVHYTWYSTIRNH